MNKNLKISDSIVINADANKVWDVLTNPEKIKIYLGIPETITDWKVGSPAVWRGEFGGVKFENKGKILENNYESLLKFEYWSSFGGYEDKPENYSVITYTLDRIDDSTTKYTYTREKIPTEQEYEMFNGHLQFVLQGIKELAEQND